MTTETLTRHLSEAVRIPTVSHFDRNEDDEAVFTAFQEWMAKTWPALYETAQFERVGKRGLLFTIPSAEPADPRGALRGPAVLMAHYDVVPAEAAEWAEDPFSGSVRDGRLFGRGSLDTKCTLVCILDTVTEALESGWRPANSLYLAFSGEEEVEGTSSDDIVSLLGERGVKPALVLDEGGAVIPEGLPGVRQRAVMIGVAEKGIANVEATLKGAGGHAATPPRHTLLGRMAKAAVAIENHRFRAQLTPQTRAMFRVLGSQKGGPAGFAFRHIDAFRAGVAPAATYLGGTFNAMVRSTAAVTMMEGSPAFTILPGKVSMGINLRLLGTDTIDSAVGELKKAVGDRDIEFRVVSGCDPSPVSKIGGRAWQYLVRTAASVWPDAVAAPYTLNNGTDSRFWHRICDHVYKLTPMVMTKEERGMVHGVNEQIRLEALKEMADFYRRLIRGL